MEETPQTHREWKGALHGDYLEHERRRLKWSDRLARKATHKALDMPDEEDVNINSYKGMGWRELLVLVAGAAITAGVYAKFSQPAVAPPPPPAATFSDTDTTLNPRFVD